MTIGNETAMTAMLGFENREIQNGNEYLVSVQMSGEN